MNDLVKRRKALGYSQQQVAEEAECSVSSVRLFESGYRSVGLSETLCKIEEALDRSEKART